MLQKKRSLFQTIQLIVDILSGENVINQRLNETIDWETIVKVASEHLILPAVYCRLQQQSLLKYLPDDLVVYLDELTALNRTRNQDLLKEAQYISKLFTSNHIDHVFLKGIAIIAGNYFEDLSERMIGDIDILIASKDLDKAFELLVNEGYSQFIGFNYTVKNYRHLPRQISDSNLGAIELHDQLLTYKHQKLIHKDDVIMSKIMKNGIFIPNSEYLIRNAILGHQVNDKAYYYNTLKLKGVYDSMALGLSQNRELIDMLSHNIHSARFLELASLFYPQFKPTRTYFFSRFWKKLFILQLEFPKFGSLLHSMKSKKSALLVRFKLIAFNKSYRRHIFKNKVIK